VAAPAASDSEPAKPEKREAEDAGGEERYGPLSFRRLRKEDGRALIVYSWVEPPERREEQ
jgi:hypothetical protein